MENTSGGKHKGEDKCDGDRCVSIGTLGFLDEDTRPSTERDRAEGEVTENGDGLGWPLRRAEEAAEDGRRGGRNSGPSRGWRP